MPVGGEVNLAQCAGLLQIPDAPGFGLEVRSKICCRFEGEDFFERQ
jgi:hypothetical protein